MISKHLIISFFSLFLSISLYSNLSNADEKKSAKIQPKGSKIQYSRKKIVKERFGDAERQLQIAKAFKIAEQINAVVFGQEVIAETIRDKLVLYLDGLETDRREPVAINLMGLPGIGKTAIIDVLTKLGFQILKLDAQSYAPQEGASINKSSIVLDLDNGLREFDRSKPIILVIEEIDKLPEIQPESAKEITQEVIGSLNQILSEGRFNLNDRYSSRQPVDVTKVFVMTTMNLSPSEISNFSKEALGSAKSFYDFTPEDFANFHKWLSNDSAAIPKVLSRLFRPNTVSRLMPNSALVSPLSTEAYRKIVAKTAANTIAKNTLTSKAGLRLEVKISDKLIDYLNQVSVYAPSGARSSVTKTDQLVRQLLVFSKRIFIDEEDHKKQKSLGQPRLINLDFEPTTQKVIIEITSQKILKNREIVNDKTVKAEITYNQKTGLFSQPDSLSEILIPLNTDKSTDKKNKSPKIFKKDIRAARFPEHGSEAKGLSKFVNTEIFGQSKYTKLMENLMNQYLVRPPEAKTAPLSVIFAGFPGIGKSEMINLTGKYLDLPIIKINLQQFTSNAPETAGNLIGFISDEIEKLKQKGKTKYILLVEELDKVFEIDPSSGKPVDRPVMGIIKDLMNNGQASVRAKEEYGAKIISVDVRDAFLAVTMNFAMDRFNFKADPRLTTLDDVNEAWKSLSTRLSDLKGVLGSIFLPETVNRMISNIYILKPLDREAYLKVIEKQKDIILKDRFEIKNGISVGSVKIKLSPTYSDYLFNESVVPSEGARYAAKVSRSWVSQDFEAVLKRIPKNSTMAVRSLVVVLDYNSETREVTGSLETADEAEPVIVKNVYSRIAELNFPPLSMRGKIPKERLITSLHEFGHALAAIRAGLPFESITVVPPQNSVGGYVKFRNMDQSADDFIGKIYSLMASRAMERIMLSENPKESTAVVDITAGASNDILQATKLIFHMIYEFGFDPNGGVMERMGVDGPSAYANFSNLTHEIVEALGFILRDVEDTIVNDFLLIHNREWYVEKIYQLALNGGMSEKEFYELNELSYPGEGWVRNNTQSPLYDLFAGKIKESDSMSGFDWQPSFHEFKQNFIRSIQKNLHQINFENKNFKKSKVLTTPLSCKETLK